ncbi:MAG: site-specific DNA-methyltransferase [Treponema sp.]|jgi:site-specific DNA-methyltransferase (adenine-specific)|nr:site-specific DNA-methyltransferase [Treponema sp.]
MSFCKETIGPCTLYHARMEDVISFLRFDHVFTDPPYLYIKTHDFDKEFDEALLFENARRIMPDNGFIALFGRGTSFYRWNTRLAELGFVFKEEIVWNKRYTTAPCIALSRIHETISIHTKKTGKIRRAKVPYVEQKQYDIESVINDVKRIKSAINTEAGLNRILAFLQGGELYKHDAVDKFCITQQPGIKKPDRAVATINSISAGMNERSIIHYMSLSGGVGTTVRTDLPQENREIKTLRMIQDGMREKSILEAKSDHYKLSHPTQKPVRLAERIIALISDPGDTIYDPFMGSGSFGVACINTGRKYIGSEIDEGYFNAACKRIRSAVAQPKTGVAGMEK